MAYAIIHYFPGGTKDQYEKSIAAVHPSSGGLPTGQIFHTAGPTPGGWTVIAVHPRGSLDFARQADPWPHPLAPFGHSKKPNPVHHLQLH